MSETATETVEKIADEGPAVQAAPPDLPECEDQATGAAAGQIDLLLDTALSVEVRLGEIQTEIRMLLSLAPGSVLEMDKEVGEPVDLYLRGIRFATGQLVVVGDHLGVRIREIIASAETKDEDL